MFFNDYEPYKIPYTLKNEKYQTTNPIPTCKSERFKIIKTVLPKGEYLDLSGSSKCCFDADVTFTVLKENKNVWMSDTPFERRSNAGAIKKAHGDVLVAGLGIGYTLLQMVKKKNVETIIVLEREQELIDLVWPHILPYCKGKVSVICCDAKKFQTGKKFDFIWLDIWENTGGFEYCKKQMLKQFWKNMKDVEEKSIMFWGEYFHKDTNYLFDEVYMERSK